MYHANASEAMHQTVERTAGDVLLGPWVALSGPSAEGQGLLHGTSP